MGQRYSSPSVICPYYKSQTMSVIYCEGMDGNSSIHLAFGDPDGKCVHQKRACMTYDYAERCRIA